MFDEDTRMTRMMMGGLQWRRFHWLFLASAFVRETELVCAQTLSCGR